MSKKPIKILLYILTALLLAVGVGIFVYPLVSANISENQSQNAIQSFENYKQAHIKNNFENNSDKEECTPEQKSDETLLKLYNEMQSYNEQIYREKQSGLCDAWSYEQTAVDLTEYGLGDCPVGVLRVPQMKINMPLYLGASYNNMSRGATQLGETSMPIGGINTSCVIAGHRGWNGARYFLDIESLSIGDRVFIDNLWETLEYSVSEIKIINPDDIDAVKIQDGKDMVTLFTCHPYWDSTYRYAVFCTRVYDDNNNLQNDTQNNSQSTLQTTVQPQLTDENSVADTSETRIKIEQTSYYIIPIALVLLALVLFLMNHRKKNKK